MAERHHDLCLLDEQGAVLAKRRIADGLAGVTDLHALVARHAEDPWQVVVGIELDRGPLLAAGYQVYGINPLAASRYRDRHVISRAKSDRGDAKVLADLVRTDRHNHRQVAGDSQLAVAVKVLARAHQRLVWARQDQVNALRSALREFYPGALAAFGATTGWPTPAPSGRSPQSRLRRVRGAATTGTAPPATATPKRCAPWGIGWSASCTAVWPRTSFAACLDRA